MSTKVTISIRNVTGKTNGYEGTVNLPGLKSTKLQRKDGTTLFPTTSALKTVARGVGKRFNLEVEYNEPQQKAAKKSSTAQSRTTSSKKAK